MSAAEHEQTATEIEEGAAGHSQQHDPIARAAKRSCGTQSAPVGPGPKRICWTSTVNPTAEHEQEAKEARELAARHRLASAELRAAEERACLGIAPDDRDMSPFVHHEDIVSVERLYRNPGRAIGRTYPDQFVGARVVLRAVPGLTAEGLQHVVSCHVARNATLGHESPDMRGCPLVPKGLGRAEVERLSHGFAVNISSENRETADEIFARAERLAPQKVAK